MIIILLNNKYITIIKLRKLKIIIWKCNCELKLKLKLIKYLITDIIAIIAIIINNIVANCNNYYNYNYQKTWIWNFNL